MNEFNTKTRLAQPDFRSNSLPPYNTATHNSPPPTNQFTYNNMTTDNTAVNTNPASCDLQDVIYYYQSQPELLRLILLSKVEEDKRKAEEAKLRAKELDMFLFEQQQQQTDSFMKRPSVLDILMEDTTDRRDSALGASFDASPQSDTMSLRYIYYFCLILLS